MKNHIRSSREDKVFSLIAYMLATFALVITLYPLLYCVSASFSDPLEVVKGNVILFPKKPTLIAYEAVSKNKSMLLGYRNTVVYTLLGTALNVIMTTMAAYPLSKKDFRGRSLITVLFTVTVFFTGGMVPNFLLIRDLGLYDSIGSLLLPSAVSMWNLVIMRTYFQSSIPEEICESAYMDGCSNIGTLLRIVLPLSMPILAVMVIFYGVGHWNSYFSALLYLRSREKYPLSLVLREILLQGMGQEKTGTELVDSVADLLLFETLKYAVIIVSSLPMLILYPALQRYFVKGALIGSLKG